MRSEKKRLAVFGIGALVLLAIALSNSAIISSIDTGYSKIIKSDITNRKNIASVERNCNTIQNTAVSILLTEDINEQICLQNEIYTTFNRSDKLLQSLEKSDLPITQREQISALRSSYLKYKESYVNYSIMVMEQNHKKSARFATTTLQKNYDAVIAATDIISESIETAMVSGSTSLTKQNNLALRFITGAGMIPLVFWAVLLLATFLWTSVSFRKLRPE